MGGALAAAREAIRQVVSRPRMAGKTALSIDPVCAKSLTEYSEAGVKSITSGVHELTVSKLLQRHRCDCRKKNGEWCCIRELREAMR